MKGTQIVLAIVAASSAWAQNTVVVSGKITDAVTGLPVEDAAIALTQNGRAASRSMHYSDAGGNYSFEDVAPGTGSVEIQAKGFLAFQKTNPDDVSIQIAPDHAEHNFKLTRAASITGRIEGEGGGVPGGIVATLFLEDFTDGVRHFTGGTALGPVNFFGASIGPDGSFEFTGLAPGRYIVSAGAGARAGQTTRLQFMMDRSTGKAVLVKPPAEDYVQTYYPGTTEFAAAIPISLAAGETTAADFKVAKRPLFRASGEIDAPGVEHWEGTVQVTPEGEGLTRSVYSGTASIPGPFTVEGLPPGQYTVQSILGPAVPTANGVSFSGIRVNLSFAITDHEVAGLMVVPETGGQLGANGFFRMAKDGSALPAGLSVQFAFPAPGGESTPIPAAPTGEFWLNGASGDYSVQPVVPAGYAATEVRYGGANYLNSLIPMNGGSTDSSLTIVLTDQTGSVTGSILDRDSKPVSAEIALLPDPLPANFDFRAIRVVKNDAKGAFTLSGLAPGRYKAVALTGDDRKRDRDMAILGDKVRAADAFEIVAGQSLTINVGLDW